MGFLEWHDVVVNWTTCVLDSQEEVSLSTEPSRREILTKLLLIASDPETQERTLDQECDSLQELNRFLKDHFPKYHVDLELYFAIGDNSDDDELICVLSLMLFYCTVKSSHSLSIQNRLCTMLSNEMQLQLKNFFEKFPNDDHAVTRLLVKKAVCDNGFISRNLSESFSYTPPPVSTRKRVQSETPLKSFFESPFIRQQKLTSLEKLESRKLQAQLDSMRDENTDLQEELHRSNNQIKHLNEKLQEKFNEVAKLRELIECKEMEANFQEDKNSFSVLEQKLKQELKSSQVYIKQLEDKVSDLEDENYKAEKKAKHAEACSGMLKIQVNEFESSCFKLQNELQAAEEKLKFLTEENIELKNFIEQQKEEQESSSDYDSSATAAIPESAENLGQTVIDLQLHEQIEENKKLRRDLEEKVQKQLSLQEQVQHLQVTIESIQNEMKETLEKEQMKNIALSKINSSLDSEMCSLQGQITEIKTQLQRTWEERDKISKELEIEKLRIITLTQTLEEAQKTEVHLKISLENAVTVSKNTTLEIEKLSNEINEVKSSLANEQKEKCLISDDLKLCKSTILELQTDLKVSKQKNLELEKVRDDLSTQCQTFQREMKVLLSRINELQCQVSTLDEERRVLAAELESEKVCKNDLAKVFNTLTMDYETLKVVNTEISSESSKLGLENSGLRQEIKQAEEKLLCTEKNNSDLCLQVEAVGLELNNVKHNHTVQNQENLKRIEELKQELEILKIKEMELKSQMVISREQENIMEQKLDMNAAEIICLQQANKDLLEEKTKILQETDEKITKTSNEFIEIQTTLNKKLECVTQERDNIIMDLKVSQDKLQTLEDKFIDISQRRNILQNELLNVLSEVKYFVINFAQVREKLLECNKLKEIATMDVESVNQICSADICDPNTLCVCSVAKHVKLFNTTLTALYEVIVNVCTKCKTFENEVSQLQLDNKGLKKLNEIIAQQNNTLLTDNTSLHSALQELKIKEEMSKKMDVQLKQLNEKLIDLEKEKVSLTEVRSNQKLEIDTLNIQNQSLVSKNLNLKEEIKDLKNQNKNFQDFRTQMTSLLNLGEKYSKLMSKKYEADVKFEKVFSIKDQLLQKLCGIQKCLQIIEVTYGKFISSLPMTDTIRTMKLESEAKLACVENEFSDLSNETLGTLHLCLDETKKHTEHCLLIFKNLSNSEIPNINDVTLCDNGLPVQCESSYKEKSTKQDISDSFEYINLIEVMLPSIESRMCAALTRIEDLENGCKSLDIECKERLNLKLQSTVDSCDSDISKAVRKGEVHCDFSAEEDGWNTEDSLEVKSSSNSAAPPKVSIENAGLREGLEKTLSLYKIKTEELNGQVLSLKLSLSVAESKKAELHKQLVEVGDMNERLLKEKETLSLLKNELENKLKEKEDNFKALNASHFQSLSSNYSALKAESSLIKNKLSEKENEVVEHKKTILRLKENFNTEIQKKSTEIRNEYEQKLESLKAKMRLAYRDEVAKMQSKLSSAEETISCNQKTISNLKSKLLELQSRLTSESQEKKFLEKLIYRLRNNGADQSVRLDDVENTGENLQTSTIQDGARFAVPRSREPRQNISSVVNESFTVFTRRSVQKGLLSGMGQVFRVEDEQGEEFNNTYLADMKSGICNIENSKDRIGELQYRNSLCPPHLKSSYPAETQFHDPSAVKEDDIKTTYNKPGPPTPGKKGRISLQGSEVHTPRSILKEFNESSSSRKGTTPSRIKALFSTKSARRDENVPVTPRGRGLSLFRKPPKSRLP